MDYKQFLEVKKNFQDFEKEYQKFKEASARFLGTLVEILMVPDEIRKAQEKIDDFRDENKKAKDKEIKEINDLKFQKVLLENRIEGQEEEIERKINEIKNLKSQVKDLSSSLELNGSNESKSLIR